MVKGENYLVPVDADLKDEGDVQYKTLALGQILAKLDAAKPRVNIVMLDACRDNPFARSWRSAKGGLASIDAPAGTLIAFATAPGKTAADGVGSNGLYTSHLLKQLVVPNQRIEDVLKNTRKAVAAASNNEQIPWDSSSLTGDFYFKVSANNLSSSKGEVQVPTSPGGSLGVAQSEVGTSATRSSSQEDSPSESGRDQGEAASPSLSGFFNSLGKSVRGLLDN